MSLSRWLVLTLAALAASPAAAQISGGIGTAKKEKEEARPFATLTAPPLAGYERGSAAFLRREPGLAPTGPAPAYSSAGPYSLNTFSPYYNPYGYIQDPTSATIQGIASLTAATGQYYLSTQQARILREQSRQMSLETARQRLQLQLDYERNRPTAVTMARQLRTTDLEWARNFASRTEISSGSTLNVLLRSVLESPGPTAGPNIPLTAETLRGVNLHDPSSTGNLGLVKEAGKIAWPEALQEKPFDPARDGFAKNFAKATEYVSQGKEPDAKLLRELRAELKALSDKLDDAAPELAPSRYIESRRLLNQLRDALRGMSDARQVKAFGNGWRKDVKNVSGLVGHLQRSGLTFAPAAAPEDYAAYSALYFALRAYEREVAQTGLSTKQP